MRTDASRPAGTCTLITIPISHFCEKARWALDRAGVPYRERAHIQVIHRIAVKRAGGGTTAPVLVTGEGRVLPESDEIVAWTDSQVDPERRLIPADGALAGEVRDLERGFDERLGPEGRRWMYHEMRGRRDLVLKYGPTGVPAWERRIFPWALPVAWRVIDRYLDITPALAAYSLGEVRASFDEVAARLSDGRRYLTGERFTAADLAFAALSASVLMPPEYGVPLPQPDELSESMGTVVRELRDHPAGQYALRLYRDERRPLAASPRT
jgi:glutathione S-transferase